MSRRSFAMGFVLLIAVLPGLGATAAASPGTPGPLPFASQLDLSCLPTDAYDPPPTVVTTRHLNPVLAGLPVETTKIGTRDQLCVPVAKNGKIPPPGIVDYVKWVDLACYRIQGEPVRVPLRLTHLNPVVQSLGIPDSAVTMLTPEHLCVPVAKNGVFPPPEILRAVSHLDLKCYSLDVLDPTARTFPLILSQLNPVLAGLPKLAVDVTAARRLCVPVQKKGDEIPADVLNTIQWVDQEKFDLVVGPSPGPAVIGLRLTHLNPVLAGWPVESATVSTIPSQLGLPVAKNGKIPPAA